VNYDAWKTSPPERSRRQQHDPDRELEEERNGDTEVA